MTADQVAKIFILGMHGDCGVAQHGFGARGGDREHFVAALDRVADVPEMAFGFAALHFQVGNGRLEFRIPIHQTAVAIDQALGVQRDEHFADGFRQALIHRETFARPVQTGAEAAQLGGDGTAGLGFPIPDAGEKGVAAQSLAGGFFLGE